MCVLLLVIFFDVFFWQKAREHEQAKSEDTSRAVVLTVVPKPMCSKSPRQVLGGTRGENVWPRTVQELEKLEMSKGPPRARTAMEEQRSKATPPRAEGAMDSLQTHIPPHRSLQHSLFDDACICFSSFSLGAARHGQRVRPGRTTVPVGCYPVHPVRVPE